MRTREKDIEMRLKQLNEEFFRLKKRLQEIIFEIDLFDGTPPALDGFNKAENVHYKENDKNACVSLLEVDLKYWIFNALIDINEPCALKEIIEYIGENNEKLSFSTLNIKVTQCLKTMIKKGQVNILKKTNRKYYLKYKNFDIG